MHHTRDHLQIFRGQDDPFVHCEAAPAQPHLGPAATVRPLLQRRGRVAAVHACTAALQELHEQQAQGGDAPAHYC